LATVGRPYLEDDDETLLLRMMEKDEAALAEVLRRYGPRVQGFLRARFGDVLRDPERREVLNVAAFSLYRFAERFKAGKGTLRGWFFKIARNAAISFLRGEKRHTAQELEYEPAYDPAEDHPDDCPDVDSKEHKRLKELDNIIFSKLTGFEQIVAINDFKAGGDADSERLAALHGKTLNNVYATRSKVKKKILEMMRDWDSRQSGGRGSR
jgi:DNA-directed RNA polymerase specialized sigma24 family protein